MNYYAITDNSAACNTYRYQAQHILFKWLNRRSQRHSCNWDYFAWLLARHDWPTARIRHDLNPFRKGEALPKV